jgi:glycosyltransferase involved in cell wall biosynthesis
LNNNLKIAVIGLKGLPAFGGAATVGENIILNLKEDFLFTVYSTATHTDRLTDDYDGYRQIVFKKLFPGKFNSLYYYIISAFHALFKGDYDLVHFHHRAAIFLAPLLRLRYKVILTTHGLEAEPKFESFDRLFKLQDRVFLNCFNFITTVSKKDFRIVTEQYKCKRAIYIPNGIDPSNGRNFHNTNNGDFIAFAAGRIVRSKGCHTFLRALIQLKYQDRVVIIGDLNQDSDYKAEIKKLAENLPKIEFIGLIKQKEKLLALLSNAKLFIYPSYLESMSMMILEAASVKTPMICANIQANIDIFTSEEILYAEVENITDWSRKIKYALDHPAIMKKKSEDAFQKLSDHYTWEKIAASYKQVFVNQIQPS